MSDGVNRKPMPEWMAKEFMEKHGPVMDRLCKRLETDAHVRAIIAGPEAKAAYEAAHAAGYAEAVADIRAELGEQWLSARQLGHDGAVRALQNFDERIKRGAHVGAAKRSGT